MMLDTRAPHQTKALECKTVINPQSHPHPCSFIRGVCKKWVPGVLFPSWILPQLQKPHRLASLYLYLELRPLIKQAIYAFTFRNVCHIHNALW